jgi:hypothetical protein
MEYSKQQVSETTAAVYDANTTRTSSNLNTTYYIIYPLCHNKHPDSWAQREVE